MKKGFLFILITSGHLLSATSLRANDYPVNDIPDSLKTNADVVIRDYSAEFTQSDINNATYKVTKVTTILNKKGEEAGHFMIYGDKFRELSSFSGTLRDASGKIIKKVKKGDLFTSSMTEDYTMSDDNVSIVYECQSPSYPYTIEYTYQQKWKKGIAIYPPFVPMPGYSTSIENANYKLELPTDVKLRHKSTYKDNIKEEEINDKKTYIVSLSGVKAIQYEKNLPDFKELAPVIFLAPSDFCYDSHCGNMETWTNYGLWVHKLLKDRDVLPPAFVEKLKELTKDSKSEREKVKTLYEYLQANTRYVSIQLGIGGFQPTEASSVLKMAYGDCKGLSNLMTAMLKAIGIPSNYCEISMAKEKDLYPDYANLNQTDHVIALVPLKNDSIWLECTSSTAPFGYISSSYAGHDALVITEKGGQIIKLPSYTDKQNRTDSSLEMTLDENGDMKGVMAITEHLKGYEYLAWLINSNDRNKFVSFIHSNIELPKADIGAIQTHVEKSSLPSAKIATDFKANAFASKTGNRIFIPICPFKKASYTGFSATKRNENIVFKTGYSENDTVIINIPPQHVIESLPKPITLNTPFGSFITNIKQEEGKIIYTQNIDHYSGTYDKDKYEELKDFYSKIASSLKQKLVLRKTE